MSRKAVVNGNLAVAEANTRVFAATKKTSDCKCCNNGLELPCVCKDCDKCFKVSWDVTPGSWQFSIKDGIYTGLGDPVYGSCAHHIETFQINLQGEHVEFLLNHHSNPYYGPQSLGEEPHPYIGSWGGNDAHAYVYISDGSPAPGPIFPKTKLDPSVPVNSAIISQGPETNPNNGPNPCYVFTGNFELKFFITHVRSELVLDPCIDQLPGAREYVLATWHSNADALVAGTLAYFKKDSQGRYYSIGTRIPVVTVPRMTDAARKQAVNNYSPDGVFSFPFPMGTKGGSLSGTYASKFDSEAYPVDFSDPVYTQVNYILVGTSGLFDDEIYESSLPNDNEPAAIPNYIGEFSVTVEKADCDDSTASETFSAISLPSTNQYSIIDNSSQSGSQSGSQSISGSGSQSVSGSVSGSSASSTGSTGGGGSGTGSGTGSITSGSTVGSVGSGSGTSSGTGSTISGSTACEPYCFKMGNGGSFTVPADGTLYLAYNDVATAYADNTSYFTVYINDDNGNSNTYIVQGTDVDGVAVPVFAGVIYRYIASGRIGNGAIPVPYVTGPDGVSTPDNASFLCPNADYGSLIGSFVCSSTPAGPITLYNTAQESEPAIIPDDEDTPDCQSDKHWRYCAGSTYDQSSSQPAYVVIQSTDPYTNPSDGGTATNGTHYARVAADCNDHTGQLGPNNHYQTVATVTDLASLGAVTGQYSCLGILGDILVNGVSTGFVTDSTSDHGDVLYPFSIPAHYFVLGTNTIDFLNNVNIGGDTRMTVVWDTQVAVSGSTGGSGSSSNLPFTLYNTGEDVAAPDGTGCSTEDLHWSGNGGFPVTVPGTGYGIPNGTSAIGSNYKRAGRDCFFNAGDDDGDGDPDFNYYVLNSLDIPDGFDLTTMPAITGKVSADQYLDIIQVNFVTVPFTPVPSTDASSTFVSFVIPAGFSGWQIGGNSISFQVHSDASRAGTPKTSCMVVFDCCTPDDSEP